MLKSLVKRALVILAILTAAAVLAPTALDVAQAKSNVVEDIQNEPLPPGASFAQVEQAVLSALTTRGWQLLKRSSGSVDAQYARRDFSVTINVSYTASAFSVTYKDSNGLRYDPESRTIHQNYNRWINNLRLDIPRLVSNAALGAPLPVK